MQGTVKFWNISRGFGFIVADDGSGDVFCHVTALVDAKSLEEGTQVESEKVTGRDGRLSAKDVRPVEAKPVSVDSVPYDAEAEA